MGKHLEVCEVVTEVRCDPYVILLRKSQAELHGSKEASSTGDGRSHDAELPQNLVPLLDAYTFLVPQFIEDLYNMLLFCSVSSMVPLLVSRIQPNISFHWLQPPSPLFSFFLETASFLLGVLLSGCAKILTMECMMHLLVSWQSCREPWARLMKSST